MKVFVSTVPFATIDPSPLSTLAAAGVEVLVNPLGRRLTEEEEIRFLADCDALIAGTEPITDAIMAACPRLKLIARVGIGLDNVDLAAARRRGVAVTYTPDAPSPAVVELTIGLMLAASRHVVRSDALIRAGRWTRLPGRRLAESTVGLIGVGRIGGGVARALLGGFPGVRVLACDVAPAARAGAPDAVAWVEKEQVFAEADIVSLHVPLTRTTRGFVDAVTLAGMKPDAVLINTARGGVVDEDALHAALSAGRPACAAVDVFADEPYSGPLTTLDNVILTAHQGSMTADCRARMEVEATAEVVRFSRGRPLERLAPDEG